jgi:hypothetical protein
VNILSCAKRWYAERIFGGFQRIHEDFAIEGVRQIGRINEWWAEAVVQATTVPTMVNLE